MIGPNTRQSFRPNSSLFCIIVGFGFGLLLGIASLRFSPLLALGMLLGAVFVYAILKRPEVGLLCILVMTSSIVFENDLPLIPIGGGSLNIPDVFLLALLGLIFLRWLLEPSFKIVRTPLDWPLLVFYGVMLLSTFIAIGQSSLGVVEARRGIRVMSYYLTFFVVTNLVRERRQLNFLLNGLFLLATIVAAAMVMQFLLGNSLTLLPGRVEVLKTQRSVFEDVTRILPPGLSILLVSFVATFCILVLQKFKPPVWLQFLQWALLGVAIVVTFLRSYWAALAMVFVLLVYLVRGYDRQRLMVWGLVVMSSAAVVLLLVFSDPNSKAAKLVGASTDRGNTLLSSGTFQGQDSSLNWRIIEDGYALSAIMSHPLIGLGMGAKYRPWDNRLDYSRADGSAMDFTGFIHNGHLWILLDTGLFGYVAFMGLSLAFLVRGFKYWRSVADSRMRGVVLGFALVYLAVLIAAIVNSTFVQWYWTPVFGIVMGINEVILIRYRQEESTL